jgi:CRISPR-associated exonuclease Cas4
MVSGLHIQYYHVCHRKLWLYAKGIGMEEEYERVHDGKLLHASSYKNVDRKELLVDESFKIDAIDGEYVREVKVSSKMTEVDRWQLLFYLYELKKRGLNKKGLISYTLEKKTEEVILKPEDENKLDKMIKEIEEITNTEKPLKVKKVSYCKKCAYFDFCFTDEGEADE